MATESHEAFVTSRVMLVVAAEVDEETLRLVERHECENLETSIGPDKLAERILAFSAVRVAAVGSCRE